MTPFKDVTAIKTLTRHRICNTRNNEEILLHLVASQLMQGDKRLEQEGNLEVQNKVIERSSEEERMVAV